MVLRISSVASSRVGAVPGALPKLAYCKASLIASISSLLTTNSQPLACLTLATFLLLFVDDWHQLTE